MAGRRQFILKLVLGVLTIGASLCALYGALLFQLLPLYTPGWVPLFLAALMLAPVSVALLMTLPGFYLVDVLLNRRLKPRRKALWAVLLLAGSPVAMPIYWYAYFWRTAEAGPGISLSNTDQQHPDALTERSRWRGFYGFVALVIVLVATGILVLPICLRLLSPKGKILLSPLFDPESIKLPRPDVSDLSPTAQGLVRRVETSESGSVFSGFTGRITSLHLNSMELSPAEWDCLAEFWHLERLALIRIPHTAGYLREVSRIPNLRSLDIWGASDITLSRDDLVVLSRLGGLQSLELTGCHLDDASLTALAPLSNISTLKLDNNPGISDAAIPTILAQFPRLKEFSFKGTSISQDGISRLKKEKPKLELE